MKAQRALIELSNTLYARWRKLRQSNIVIIIAANSVLLLLTIGLTLQKQAAPDAQLHTAQINTPTQIRFNVWTAEYFTCPNEYIDQNCKRVLQKNESGRYSVIEERFPLEKKRFVQPEQFALQPTHVRLSHQLTEDEDRQFKQNWKTERPVLSLLGQPVCKEKNCISEDVVLPIKQFTERTKTLIQFDSQIDFKGQFGPRAYPPVAISQSKVHELFNSKNNYHRGLFFEFGITVLFPLFFLIVSIWAKHPKILVAFNQFLMVKALWFLTSIDVFAKQNIFFESFTLKNSFALSAFVSGLVFCSALNLLSVIWCNKRLKQRHQTTLAAGFSITALGLTYLVPAESIWAGTTLRLLDFFVSFTCAFMLGLAISTLSQNSLKNTWVIKLKTSWRPEQGVLSLRQAKQVFVSFSLASLASLWVFIDTHHNTYVFNWSNVLLPLIMTFVILLNRPQLTRTDLQHQNKIIALQDNLIRIISQLSTTKTRAQAINLAVNFCNFEFSKLGYQSVNFQESLQTQQDQMASDRHEVKLCVPVRSSQQTFGWIVAYAKKKTEDSILGEKMIAALSVSLAQHLDMTRRTTILESETNSAQKFIPKDLLRFFGIMNSGQIDSTQDYSLNGSTITVILRNSINHDSTKTTATDFTIINELNSLFSKGADQFGGYVVQQFGMQWNIIFRNGSDSALRWLEATQSALRQWSLHRQSLGLSAHQCCFGAHATRLNLKFHQNSGLIRPWIQSDVDDVSKELAQKANEYNSSALLSRDFLNSLTPTHKSSALNNVIRLIDRIWNNTKTGTLDVYEYFGGEPEQAKNKKQSTAALFSEGIKFYLAGNFEKAQHILQEITTADPQDTAAKRLLISLSDNIDFKAA